MLNFLKNLLSNNWISIFSKIRNDFVFEKRNKVYGAYFLRKGYFKTLFRSYLAAILLILFLIYTPMILDFIDSLNNKNLLTDKEIAELSKSTDILLSPPPDIQSDLNKPPAVPRIIFQKKDSAKIKPKENIQQKDSSQINQDSILLAQRVNDSINNRNDSLALADAKSRSDIINNNGALQMKVDAMPEFPGGEMALNKYMKEHIKYSLRAKAMNTNGTVNVSFVVEENGSLSSIRLLMIAGNGLDDEVINLIKSMPHWKPGMRRGKPQRFVINLPVNFYLKGK